MDLSWIDFLQQRLKAPLPGWAAQARMAPPYHPRSQQGFTVPAAARQSAVGVLFLPGSVGWEVLFTLRSKGLSTHKGQISFPGGGIEAGETVAQAALRETWEEVGLAAEQITLLGQLTELYVPPSNSVIHPVLGWLVARPAAYTLSEAEVAEAFSVPLDKFLQQDLINYQGRVWEDKQSYAVPYWQVHTTPLWGATAIILSELVALYAEYKGVTIPPLPSSPEVRSFPSQH